LCSKQKRKHKNLGLTPWIRNKARNHLNPTLSFSSFSTEVQHDYLLSIFNSQANPFLRVIIQKAEESNYTTP